MTNTLRLAVDALYDIFRAPVPRRIDGCPCCVDTKRVDRMHMVKLRDLTGDDLARYAACVFTTVGSEADFRYFLPRILELSATDPGWYPSLEIVAGKLRLAAWLSWPDGDRQAIFSYFRALFAQTLAAYAAAVEVEADIDAVLCAMAIAGLDIAPCLELLGGHVMAVRELHKRHYQALERRAYVSEGFWEKAPEAQAALLAAFLTSEPVWAIMSEE